MKKQLLFTLLATMLLFSKLLAQTTWTGGAGTTTWSTAGNWSNGVPDGTKKPITIPTGAPRYPALVAGNNISNTATGGGILVIQNGASLTASTSTTDIQIIADVGSTFTINSGGSLNLTGGASAFCYLQVNGAVTNSGTINLNSYGEIYLADGTLTCSSGTMNISANGFIDGSGTYTGCLYTNPSGGFIGASTIADCITFGSGLTNNGTIRLELGNGACSGNNSDKITVTGTATLGSGTFSISGGTAGTTYTILTATSIASFTNQDISLGSGKFAHLRKVGNEIRAIVDNNAVLGIELLSFGVTTEGSKNNLTWLTGSEVNNKGFNIERSRDGATFQAIGTVKAIGKAGNYNFTDAEPINGTNYYRLRQIDNDGTETYSKVVSVANKGGKSLKVYPTLVSNGILTVDTEGGDYSIYNIVGQQVQSGKTAQRLDVSSLAKGTYIFKVGTEQAKFVKQ